MIGFRYKLPPTFPADMTNIYNKNEINNISNLNSIFTTQQINILNTAINTKEAILSFSSPLVRTTNTTSLNESLINFNNLLNRPDMNLYLLKSGGAMIGNLTTIANIGIGITNPGITKIFYKLEMEQDSEFQME